MLKRWEIKKREKFSADDTARLSVSSLTAEILAARGITTLETAQQFLNPSLSDIADPHTMKDIDKAVQRLLLALERSERVCIYGDYDVDGISGTALLVSFLRSVGLECGYYIPNRFADGYGMNTAAIDRISAQGYRLIVTVDCGISSIKEAAYCRTVGVDLIVVDHHTPKDSLPDALAVLNPLRPDCQYPFKSLAGVGVACCLLIALRRALRERGAFTDSREPSLADWLDLVALGTIADVVPLTGQNRILAYHGLKRMSTSPRMGINALKKVAGVSGAVSCGQVGFRLAPRLNASGRMESAAAGVELLLGDDSEVTCRLAAGLDAANQERQETERRIMEQIVAMVEESGAYPRCRSIVLASAEWHQGVIGIVASRLVERYNRPVILMSIDANGKAKGSGRSIRGFHLLDALNACADKLERFGGHRYAAGVGLDATMIEPFAAAFEQYAVEHVDDELLVPKLDIDVEVAPQHVTLELAQELKRLEPFGAGNPEPVLMMRGMQVVGSRIVGEQHLRLRLLKNNHYFDAIAFRMAGTELAGPLDIAFVPEVNGWNGNSFLQLKLKDIRKAQ